MAEWLVEDGIAEQRAVRIVAERIAETRTFWPGELAAGWVLEAKLAHRAAGSARGTALTEDGHEILVSGLHREAREGAAIRLEITRPALAGPGRLKRAQARPSTAPLGTPDLFSQLELRGERVSTVRRFPGSEWDELVGEALSASIDFPGGTLLFAPTPAMLTIDIDGTLAPRALALAAVTPIAEGLQRFGAGGSVAIDFPTLTAKDDRRAVDAALGEALAGWPHERTAINGFGLVQLVARLERPSLLHRAQWQRRGLVWRRLLRRAESVTGPGILELTVSPALAEMARPEDIAALERRSGTRVCLNVVANQALEAPHAQMIAHD